MYAISESLCVSVFVYVCAQAYLVEEERGENGFASFFQQICDLRNKSDQAPGLKTFFCWSY